MKIVDTSGIAHRKIGRFRFDANGEVNIPPDMITPDLLKHISVIKRRYNIEVEGDIPEVSDEPETEASTDLQPDKPGPESVDSDDDEDEDEDD